ncbi:MAG TPA: sulfocyanin-like copper-binding protein [Actinomycetota bacterium]|jgi:uncharacterized cupredoxin-like copper-binding protein|nr:sulfocyanin-like copper-binding protein [Actinomycetota bacterium]
MWNDTYLGLWLWAVMGLFVLLGVGLMWILARRAKAGVPVVVLAIALVLAAAVAASAVVTGGPSSHPRGPFIRDRTSCRAPALPGSLVRVTLGDMGSMMGGGGMMGDSTGWSMMGPWPHGSMWIAPRATSIAAADGTVSLVVRNAGSITHELVVLPLAAGRVGQRPVGPDGAVSEDGSLGEASATCAAGEGDGIHPGAEGWVTLPLAPGRYELICNLPGHYAAGMYAELDVR